MERLKQKVASSSSRVIASLQQVATGASNAPTASTTGSSVQQQQQQQQVNQDEITATQASNSFCSETQPAAAMSTAWLMAADATAHLTEEEKGILLEVFKKEEQFQRDTIKQLTAARAAQQQQQQQQEHEQVLATPTQLAGRHNRENTRPHTYKHSSGGGPPAVKRFSVSSTGSRVDSTSSVTPAHSQTSCSNSTLTIATSTSSRPNSRPCSTCCTIGCCIHAAPATPAPSVQQSSDITSSNKHHQEQPNQVAADNKVCQCRICRKTINLTSNEPYHFCSNCKQFVCDDCASYSANDKHWMCSSCRRRALNPAIPADALRELGLNQNSSAVRRMTLRLNQNELRMALNKSSTSNGGGGKSSQARATTSAKLATSENTRTGGATHQQQESCQSLNHSSSPSLQTTSGQQQNSEAMQTAKSMRSYHSYSSSRRQTSASANTSQQHDSSMVRNTPPDKQSTRTVNLLSGNGAQQQQQQQQSRQSYCEMRTGKKLLAQKTLSQPSSGQQTHPTQGADTELSRSSAPNSAPLHHNYVASFAHNNSQQWSDELVHEQQTVALSQQFNYEPQLEYFEQQQRRASAASSAHQWQAAHKQYANQTKHNSSAAAHGERLDDDNLDSMHTRRGSSQQPQQQQQQLVPVPLELQMHMRRLSDQSNLVRRSSIMANNFDGLQMARNRSHSNIDTVHQSGAYAPQTQAESRVSQRQLALLLNAQQQQQQQLGVSSPQRRLSDSGQYANNYPADKQQHLCSVVTPCAQKTARRQSSEDIHSDSSSDLDNNSTPAKVAMQQQYFANSHLNYPNNAMQQQQQAAATTISGISIPRLSISEFHQMAAHHRKNSLALLRNEQMAAPIAHDNQITPMQINVAIEQVIQQQQQLNEQQQQQQQQRQLLPQNLDQLLAMRRGSGGRMLPSIPTTTTTTSGLSLTQQQHHQQLDSQSRSLLELPHSAALASGELANNNNNDNQATAASNAASAAGFLLDLPSTSPTIRRASAPEGQNIKIVVDDIDQVVPFSAHGRTLSSQQQLIGDSSNTNGVGNMTFAHAMAHRHYHHDSYYERHILCRDDSLDPSGTHVGRGFGLQVMGGKLDASDKLYACVTWVLPGGPADKVGVRAGDKIIEWDGKCLLELSYEQVAEIIESSANIAELLVKPTPQRAARDQQQKPTNYVRSQRRLSQQTERDLRRYNNNTTNIMMTPLEQQQQQQQQQQQVVMSVNSAEQQQRRLSMSSQQLSCVTSGGSARTGTGRKLPQIPTTSAQPQLNPTTPLMTIRHASTGHLDLGGNQLSNGILSTSGNHLNATTNMTTTARTYNVNGRDQSRSASELHRASVGALNLYQQLHQQQQQVLDHAYHLSNGNAMHVLQYGGSQQTMTVHQQQQQQQQHFGSHMGYYQNNGPLAVTGQAFNHNSAEPAGLIGLQVSVDERLSTLEITVLSAHNIERDYSLDYCVRVRILPESTCFKTCTTQPSQDMNWKETFLFQNFPTQNVHRMALEIGIWVHEDTSRLSTQMVQPICEALIPIQSARERNIDFWPMRPPPTSPQARRKSLNDLFGQHNNAPDTITSDVIATHQRQAIANYQLAAYGQQQQRTKAAHLMPGARAAAAAHQRTSPMGSTSRIFSRTSPSDSPIQLTGHYQRERSASNRNLPDSNRLLNVQPRRASDEVATSSSQRLVARLSPAASRRSISVMNVGGETYGSNRSSRRGSQANILKTAQMRRESAQHQQLQQQSSNASPTTTSKYTTNCSSAGLTTTRTSDSQATSSCTPSGRRTSLVGMQSMSGYKSQKNSQSDATDHDSPLGSVKRPREASFVAHQQHNNTVTTSNEQQQQQQQSKQATRASTGQSYQQQYHHHHKQTSSGPPSTRPSSSSNLNSRRGSTEHSPAQLQRRGSFAMQTLRKLKRTMSLNKSNDGSRSNSNHDSRRSSSSSNSTSELSEDLAVTRPVKEGDTIVGRIKLSFIMTKGQFEIEIICGQDLRFEPDSTSGLYVKVYLKAKNKSNKRKTRVVQAWDSPMFKQTIKYDASLIDNKLLEVSVWAKQGSLRGKTAIGVTEIRLAEMNLAQLKTSWYNLRPIDTLSSSSIDDS